MREGREPDVHRLARVDPVDHLGRNSRLQQQGSVLRDDVHDLVAGRNDATRGLEGKAHHLPVGGGFDLGAAKLVAGGNVSGLFGLNVTAHIGQAGFHFPAKILAPGQHALADFRNGALGPDRVAPQVGNGHGGVGNLPLQFKLPVSWGIAFADQSPGVGKLLVEKAQLGRTSVQHAGIGLEQAFLTLNRFGHRLLVCGQGCLAGQEELFLILDMPGNHRIGLCGFEQVFVKFNRRSVGLFGQQAPFHGPQSQVPLPTGLVGGFGHRIVEPDKRLTGFDDRTLADEHLLDDAARLVLDRFALGIDGDHGRAWNTFIQRGQACPQEEAAEPDAKRPKSDPHGTRGIGLFGIQAVVGLVGRFDRLLSARRGVQLL